MAAELTTDSAPELTTENEELTPRIERLRRLRSAWGLLAPAGADDASEIGATGRALTDHLSSIVASHSDITPTALLGIDTLLSEFETSIQHVATSLPVSELRSSLPRCGSTERRGVLDLLDVLLAENPHSKTSVSERIGAIDFLITLACTGGEAGGPIREDPVQLTPRLATLCEEKADPDDLRLGEIEAEFFAAANLAPEDLKQELQQRTLRSRKAELGPAYFAPRVLRAIVTYNAALVSLVADEILDSSDWGDIEDLSKTATPPFEDDAPSVFESQALKNVASAVRRRAKGETPKTTPIDRIAWALDFDYLAENEHKALCENALCTPDDPLGTAILIGLLSRSLAVLSIELQEAGIPPDLLSDTWVDELSALFQVEINTYIADDAYKVACALSELKNKFLLAPLAEQHREDRREERAANPVAPSEENPESAAGAERQENARDLVRNALEDGRDASTERQARLDLQQVPWARFGQAALGLLLVGALCYSALSNRNLDLDRLSEEQLAAVSPYLEAGRRNGNGAGQAFVGEVDESWLALPIDERERTAAGLVERLRGQGLEHIMIYDDHRQIRIQALASQPVRVR